MRGFLVKVILCAIEIYRKTLISYVKFINYGICMELLVTLAPFYATFGKNLMNTRVQEKKFETLCTKAIH